MAQYFVAQTNLRLTLETYSTLTGATVLIKYKKPSGALGSWSAELSTNVTQCYFDLTSSTYIDEAGKWYFWAHATYGDGTVGKGSVATQYFLKEGDV